MKVSDGVRSGSVRLLLVALALALIAAVTGCGAGGGAAGAGPVTAVLPVQDPVPVAEDPRPALPVTRRVSVSWLPMVRTGFSEFAGSCGT